MVSIYAAAAEEGAILLAGCLGGDEMYEGSFAPDRKLCGARTLQERDDPQKQNRSQRHGPSHEGKARIDFLAKGEAAKETSVL